MSVLKLQINSLMSKEKSKNQNPETEEKDNSLIVVSIVSLVIVVGFWLWAFFGLKDHSETCRGTFGDMFGGVNALFSGLAFSGIIITILLQRKELALQRQELKETREELKRSATAQENSEIALKRQAENLKMSAKLTALNTLVSYYSAEDRADTYMMPNNSAKINAYIKKIEEILEQKEQ